jgi:hypothetical protein
MYWLSCKKTLFILIHIFCLTSGVRSADNVFVKPRQARSVSTACLKETCMHLMADMLEITQNCSQELLSIGAHMLLGLEKTITKIVRSWIMDGGSNLSSSKSVLCEKRDRLIVLKKRCKSVCDDITRLGSELKSIKAELQSLEASC